MNAKERYDKQVREFRSYCRKWLRIFQAKAGCSYSQQKAHSAMRKIRALGFLTKQEEFEVGVAWQHALMDEGRAELDDVCDKILARMGGNKKCRN